MRLESEALGVQYFSQPWGYPYLFLLLVILAASLIGISFRARPSQAVAVALWGVLLGLAVLETAAIINARRAGFAWAPALTWILQPRFAIAPFVAAVAALLGAYSSPRRQTWS